MTAVILTYHAVEEGPAPLCLSPSLFRRHVDALAEVGAVTLTISELARDLLAERLPERAVAITFDDGCASAVRTAAPLLAARGMRATFFCVAGRLGGWNDWPTQPPGLPRLRIADGLELRQLAGQGFEIGAHGLEHAPLDAVSAETAALELGRGKEVLEDVVGTGVRTLAYPYGRVPRAETAPLVGDLYDAACASGLARVSSGSDVFALPRIDAHYLRRPGLLRRVAAGGLDAYLAARRLAGRVGGRA